MVDFVGENFLDLVRDMIDIDCLIIAHETHIVFSQIP